jgi:kumamolisin
VLLFRSAVTVSLALAVTAPAQSAAGAAPVAEGAARSIAAQAVTRADLVDLGRAPATTPVRLAVTLRYRNQAELDRLVLLQGLPDSPLYHHFITSDEFAANFAPSPDAYERVAGSLRAAGFEVAPAHSNRTVIDAVAAAPLAERFFGTRIDLARQVGHGVRYVNVTPATLPASLAGLVDSVVGLDDVVKRHSDRVPAAAGAQGYPATNLLEPDASIFAAPIERNFPGGNVGLYPTAFADAYRYPSRSGFTGTGHAIAIVIDSDIADSDLTTYWKAAGVARSGKFVRVPVSGANPGINFDVGETAIDTEITSSLAPAANIYLYLTSDLSDTPIEDAYDLAVRDRKAQTLDVVNSSFGGCELGDTAFAQATNHIAEQGAALGLTFTASTGDSGGYCEYQAGRFEPDVVNSPASGPFFLAVGATKLDVNATTGARVAETAWSPGGASGGSGGGVSSFFARPAFQTGIYNMLDVPNVKVTPPATQPKGGFAGRNLPDISLDGSNASGSFLVVYAAAIGGWAGDGGTSVSSPAFAALLVEENQQRKSLAGWYDPALYSAFTDDRKKPGGIYGTEFFDIVSGSTGAGWNAHAGFDRSSGIGSIGNGSL